MVLEKNLQKIKQLFHNLHIEVVQFGHIVLDILRYLRVHLGPLGQSSPEYPTIELNLF